MKHLSIAALLILLSACSNTQQPQSVTATTATTAGTMAPAGKPVAGAITDPVCGMTKDSTWTDYTMYKGDTVWFCSPIEKETFEGNPKKYEHNLPHQ